ncbi:tRNA-splicing endonuclease subunit Sen2, partial [Austrofundulus limnaeus]|uniref:tRNA-intron lyase n=1 Tax=Austrofundulus limnaeus TaxID=52670 RepID=A0A2I4AKF1_AUSLI
MGWVPKGGGGAKYGVDFMLYRRGPPFYHSSYSVVVQRADERFGGGALRQFSWRSLAALSRITANVSKELMLCYIICPPDISEEEQDSPVYLSRLKVQVTDSVPHVRVSVLSQTHISDYLFTCLPTHLFTYPPVHLPTCSPTHLFTCLPTHLFTYPP